jgi:hypothetical protein
MIEGLEAELRGRFATLADSTDDSNWTGVIARSREQGRSGGHPRGRLMVAAALVFGVRFFDRAPTAPERIRKSFGSLSGDALAGDARKITQMSIGQGLTATLWLAPTKGGGFCSGWGLGTDRAGIGCYDRAIDATYPLEVTTELHGVSDGAAIKGSVLLDGIVDSRVQSLELRFADGDSAAIPFVWVPAPIATGFFLYAVPPLHWRENDLPTTLLGRDAEGHEVARREIHGVRLPGS